MRILRWGAAAGAIVLGSSGTFAQSNGDLARAFGAREDVEQASLSPDGTKLAFVRPRGGQGSALMILDLANVDAKPVAIAAADGQPERLSDCRWVGAARLICTIYGIVPLDDTIVYSSRIVALNSDGSNMKALPMPRGVGVATSSGSVIDWNAGEDGKILVRRLQLPDDVSGSPTLTRTAGFRVDVIDTQTMRSSSAERADQQGREFITDGYGNVRIMGRVVTDKVTGYDRSGTNYVYRKAGDTTWVPLSTVGSDGSGFDPYGVDRDNNIAYGLKRVDGRLAAFTMALDGSGKETQLFAHPQVDVDGFVRIGRRGRIVGVSYATDKRQVKYFDPALSKLAESLAKALPETPLIRFIDSSQDEDRMLLWAGADTNPGRYYLFDRKARKLEPLLEDRPALSEQKLSSVRPISYAAKDGTQIPGYLTLPPGKDSAKGLPALVMPHGGPGARDEWGFDWLAQYFAAQGYAVLQPNFRGSTGYGDAWFQKNGFKGWKTAITDVNDAGHWLLKEGADTNRLGIFGWSYGGYAALQSAVVEPDLFKAIVAVAPVTDLQQLRQEGEIFSNFAVMRDFIGTGPHLTEGSPARHADSFKAPVLMFHGDVDRNVAVAQAKLMQTRLVGAGKKSELVLYKGLDHYLEDSEARAGMLSKSANFFSTSFAAK